MPISQISFGRSLVLSPSPDLSDLGAEAELPQAHSEGGHLEFVQLPVLVWRSRRCRSNLGEERKGLMRWLSRQKMLEQA